MDAYEVVTRRLANQKRQELIEKAEQQGRSQADDSMAMMMWPEVKKIMLETLAILASCDYPFGEPHKLFDGYTQGRTWYGKKLVETQTRAGVLWLLNPRFDPFIKADGHRPYIYLGDDGELYTYVGDTIYGTVAANAFESPNELDKVISALRRLQERAKTASL